MAKTQRKKFKTYLKMPKITLRSQKSHIKIPKTPNHRNFVRWSPVDFVKKKPVAVFTK